MTSFRILFSLLCAAVTAVSAERVATPTDKIAVLDGFKIELLRSAATNEGSWVAMTVDPQGRLIVSPQGKEPMLRFTLDANGQIAGIETNAVPGVGGAMGLLYAFDALYVNGQGPQGYHLYRLRDTDGKGKFGEPELLRKWKGGTGEHGAHAIVLGPDNKLYIVCGNFVDVPEDILPTSPHKNYADDLILPRMEDGNGFGAGRKPPGGYVLRTDKDGKNAELFASGQRNTYDIAFNADGELFGFDSDMEWDWGTPWYRATRAFHIVSGADHGFREGSGKWPTYYEDSLPEVVDVGIGSPTGVIFGRGAKFPVKYQKAFFIMDWSYGRILAVHLIPRGASYIGTFETLVQGKPLNVTDMEIGPDGALYFATGGRGTQSGLYRVSYTGTPDPPAKADAISDARALRHKIEAFHGRQDPKALETVWPHLGSDDRYIRYAARIAVESQPVSEWRSRALAETNANAALTAFLALARVGGQSDQNDLLDALKEFPTPSLPEEQQLLKLRVIEVCFARHGRPSEAFVKTAIEKLSAIYPASSFPLNRELSQLLIYLEAPGIVRKTMDLAARHQTQQEQLHYIVALRRARDGWTPQDRRNYFTWFATRARYPLEFEQWFVDVGLKPANGASFNNFIHNLLETVASGMSEAEQTQFRDVIVNAARAWPTPPRRGQQTRPVLAKLIAGPVAPAELKPRREHAFVREWKMSDFAAALDGPSRGRNYENGREAYLAGQCAQCHRLNNEGGAIGPDLSGAGAKYSRRDLLESILDSSKVISDQYQNMTVSKKNGEEVTGRIIEETDTKLVLVPNPLTGEKVEVRKTDVKDRTPSKLSPMPDGLVNILTREEILDLLAYIESGGNREHASFKRGE